METENYIEVIEGLTEGQKVLVQLPQTSSTTTNSNSKNSNMTGGFGVQGMNGGMPPTGGGNGVPRN
jgi:HlyD family secretion protein